MPALVALSFAAALQTAPSPETEATLAFLERLRALGPVDLQVGSGMAAPSGRARLSMPAPLVVELAVSTGAEQEPVVRQLRLEVSRGAVRGNWTGAADIFDAPREWEDDVPLCAAGLETPDQLEVSCNRRSDLRSAAWHPPSRFLRVYLTPDGPRLVEEGLMGRTVYSPVGRPAKVAYVEPGMHSALADALRQLAETGEGPARGYLSGGSSGRGDWYGSSLHVSEVRGLDFVLERKVDGGRPGDDRVPVRWSFDYQGPGPGDPRTIVWRMWRSGKLGKREKDFWCLGEGELGVKVVCHDGKRPEPSKAKPAVAFTLSPFPEWRIDVGEGSDEAWRSVGSSRVRPRPFP